MIIYNFIYAYFYNKAGYNSLGRIYGSIHVIFTLFSHILFFIEVIYCVTNYKIHLFPESINGSLFHQKKIYLMYSIPFFVISWIFYTEKRTEKILEEFNNRDEYIIQGDANRAGLYILGPFLATIILICLKQYDII